jgi:hypothetical protein
MGMYTEVYHDLDDPRLMLGFDVMAKVDSMAD